MGVLGLWGESIMNDPKFDDNLIKFNYPQNPQNYFLNLVTPYPQNPRNPRNPEMP
jgi:hypothetical protein